MADSKELQNQLQINEAINKAIAARSAMLSKQQAQLSAQTQLAAELCKAMECRDLEGLEERINGINEAFSSAADAAEEAGSRQADASKKATEGLENNRKSAGGLLDKLGGMGGTALAAGAGFLKGFSGVGGMLKMVMGGITGIVGGLLNVGKSILSIPFAIFNGLVGMATAGGGGTDALREAMNELRGEMGSLAKGEGKAVMNSFKQLKSSTGALAQSGLSMRKVFGAGREGLAQMLKDLGEIAKETGAAFPMLKKQFEEAGDAAVMMNKGLGMSPKALGEIMRTAHNTGKSARQEMVEMGSMAIQMGDKFGVSAKTIGKNMSTLIESVEDFGNMSKKQLTATATYMAKLGLEAKDLQGVIAKFDDFESAAEGVSQLNQAFGIQLDTMEMMNAQNPAERIDMMRDAFHAAGKSVEDMTRAEKKLMAEQMGLSVSAMENALATENMGVSYEDMEEAAEESEANKMSEKEVMLELADAVKQLTQGGGGGVSGFFDAFAKGFKRGFTRVKGFKELMRAIRKSLKIVEIAGGKFGDMVGKLFDQLGLFKSLKKFFDPEVFGKFFKNALGYFEKFFNAITGKGEYSAAQLLEDLTNEFMNTFGKAGAEGASGLKTFFIKMIEIAGEVLASALPYLVTKLAEIIQGIADFISNPKPAMDAVGGAVDGIGGAFSEAFGKIYKALKPALPKLGEALKNLFNNLYELVKPFLDKIFMTLMISSITKGVITGLLVAGAQKGIMVAVGFFAKKLGFMMSAASKVEMAKAATGVATGNAGFFATLNSTITAIVAIPLPMIGQAALVLGALALMFAVGMVAFAAAIYVAAKILAPIPFADVGKALLSTLVSLYATQQVIMVAQIIQPPMVMKAILPLLAAAILFSVGMVAYALGIKAASMILKNVGLLEFAGMMVMVIAAMAATVLFVAAGLAMAAVATPAVLGMIIIGLIAAAVLFTVGMVAFGLGILASVAVLSKVANYKDTMLDALTAIVSLVTGLGLMIGLAAIFASIGIFVVPLVLGFGIAAGFFFSIMPFVKKMVGAISAMPMDDPKKIAQKVEIVAKLGAAMQAIAAVGLDAGKMAIAAEKMKPGGMEIMFKNISDLISKVSDTLITLIAMIVVLGANLTPGQAKNVEILAGAIGSIANLAGAIMSPLDAVSKMSEGMFGPSVQEVMGAVADGLVKIMEKIRTALPSLIKQIVKIATGITEDPKTLKPKMEIVSGALGAVANFASAIESVAALMPEEGGFLGMGGKDLGERMGEMTDTIAGVVSAVEKQMGPLVEKIVAIPIKNPEKALKQVQVIDKAMSALASFAGTVKKMIDAGITDMSAEFSYIARGFVNLVDPKYSSFNLVDIFIALGGFQPDEGALNSFPLAQKAMDGMLAFMTSAKQTSDTMAKMGTPLSDVVSAMVDEAEYALTALNSIGDLNAEVALQNFAQAIGTGSGEFTISNEPININMNVKVVMNAGQVARVLVDKSSMTAAGGPTLATAE